MINIKKITFFIIKLILSLVMLLTLILFFYAAFFYKPSLVEKKTEKIQITKSHLQSKNKPSKKILLSDVTNVKPVIKDSLFATVGNKAITYSDIVNEIKAILILNNQTFSQEKKIQIETAAIKSTIKRNVKKIEIEKYKFLKFNQYDLDRELENSARNLNMNLETFKNTFVSNGLDYSNIIEQYKVELLWNSLIFQLYKDRLSINQDEINEQLKLIQKKKEIEEYLISEIVIKRVAADMLESKINEIKNKIKIEGFEKVATSLSISETAVNGGNLGWLSENVISEKFKSKIINTPVGNISEPILVTNGILLFKIRNKRKSKKFVNLEEAKNSIINNEKTKILNMHSKSHYDNLKRSVTVNYY